MTTTTTDDFSATTSTLGRLRVGASASGNIEVDYDADWFRVTLEAGKSYLFGGSKDVSVNLSMPTGEDLYLSIPSPGYGSTLLPTISYRPQVSGDYFVRVGGSRQGAYSVFAKEVAPDDYPRESGTSAVLAPGASLSGSLSSWNDTDSFSLEVRAGLLYRVTLVKQESTFNSTSFYVGNSQDYSFKVSSGNSGASKFYLLAPQVSGTASIIVGSSNEPGQYTISAEIVADDFASDTGTTGRIALGSAVAGSINVPYDTDWFAINLDPGTAYAFTAVASGSANLFARLAMYDGTGKLVWNADASNMSYTPETAGKYYVSVTGNTDSSKDGAAYTLSAVAAKDDVSNLASTYPTLPVLGQFEGKIDYKGDVDHVKFMATAGNYYTIKVTAKAGSYGVSTSITLPDGTILGPFGDIAYTFKADYSGAYVVNVSGYGDALPQYTIQSLGSVADDAANVAAGARAVALGETVNGALETSTDIDRFKFHLDAGTTYKASLDGSDTHGNFADATGTYLAGVAFTPLVSGDYYFSVASYAQKTGPYAFKVNATVDALSADSSTSASVAVGGTFTGTLEAGGDQDWVAINLEAGKSYAFSATTTYYFLPVIDIVDANGVKQDTMLTKIGDASGVIVFAPTVAGKYFLAVQGSRSSQNDLSYTIAPSLAIKDDHGNDALHATAVLPGQAVRLDFGTSWDVDAFTVHLLPGYYYKATTFITNSTQPWIQFGNMYRIGPEFDYVNWTESAFKVATEGDYLQTFRASPTGYQGGFSFQVDLVGRDDFGDSVATATAMPGQATVGMLEVARDVDVLTVHLKKDAVYKLELHNLGDAATIAPYGLGISVAMANGVPITSLSAANGSTTTLTFAAFAEGDYYLTLTRPQYNESTPYLLRLLNVAGDLLAPAVSKFHPAASSAGLPVFDDIVVEFNEAILRDNGTIRLLDNAGHTFATWKGASDAKLAIKGAVLTLSNDAPLYPGAKYTLDVGQGSLSDLSGNDVAAKTFAFTAAAAKAAGNGNDLLTGSANGASIDGGAGLDIVYYQGAAADFQVGIAGGTVTIGTAGSGQKDTLLHVERLLFTSGEAIALDVGGYAGSVYRLYKAAFDRTPDAGGVGYWLKNMDNGFALRDVAREFIASTEFKQTYGSNLSNAQFIDQLYLNVLHRAGDASGVAFWNQVMAGGESRESILVSLSESAENQAATASLIGNGYSFLPYW